MKWTGRDARWLQFTLVGIEVAFLVAATWLARHTLSGMAGGSQVASSILVWALTVLALGLTVGVVIYIMRFRPITVTVTDDDVTIEQGGTSHTIAYTDMEAVTEVPQTVSSSLGVQIYPTKDFLLRTGSVDNPERPSRKWAIPGMVFSEQQMKELAPTMRKQVEKAGVHWYIAR